LRTLGELCGQLDLKILNGRFDENGVSERASSLLFTKNFCAEGPRKVFSVRGQSGPMWICFPMTVGRFPSSAAENRGMNSTELVNELRAQAFFEGVPRGRPSTQHLLQTTFFHLDLGSFHWPTGLRPKTSA
jgi:hypothetical protein